MGGGSPPKDKRITYKLAILPNAQGSSINIERTFCLFFVLAKAITQGIVSGVQSQHCKVWVGGISPDKITIPSSELTATHPLGGMMTWE